MNEPIQPEELTELLDDDLEMWAMGGTRILPNPKQAATNQAPSYPPVAYTPSAPPPPVVALNAPKSSAPIWAAVIGMTTVFALAAIVGAVLLVVHRVSRSEADTSANITVSAPPPVMTTTTPAITITTPTTIATTMATTQTATTEVAPARTAQASAAPRANVVTSSPAQNGNLQTFAVASGKPVYVDGKVVGVGGGRLKTVCGKHSVAVGTGKAKTIDIPCSGVTITVGTPDGT